MQFSQICGRVDVEAESGPIHNRRSRALLPVEHKAIPSESEAERIGVPERHSICAAAVPIRRKGAAAIVSGSQQGVDVLHRQMRQIGMDHEQGTIAQLRPRARQLREMRD